MTTPTIETIAAHRSVRSFKTDPLDKDHIELLKEAMRRGPTSSALQTYTVVFVQKARTKQKIEGLAGDQCYISQCPLLIIACADLRRVKRATDARGYPYRAHDLRSLLAATEDLTIATHNASLAAQSLGLGTVMIGGVLNGAKEISTLLRLPLRVLPVLGLCVGYPAPDQVDLPPRPRLPASIVFHDDAYTLTEADEAELLEAHDQEIVEQDYYFGRQIPLSTIFSEDLAVMSEHSQPYGWTEHVARKQARQWWTEATPKLFRDLLKLDISITQPETENE